ncbi:MAG: PDDEXK nuclease domain-containing protein [Polaromonas sp.]|nr:PDDEXK nuclease domain-containing protein [Polaromonas sp.]
MSLRPVAGAPGAALLGEIKALIQQARSVAARQINSLQVRANFEIGRRIVEEEQRGAERADYGSQLLKSLATALTEEFGSGFSKRNLDYMRKFFLVYRDRLAPIVQKPSAQLPALAASLNGSHDTSAAFRLSWSHYVFLIGVKNPDERQFYEIESAQNDWSLPELRRQFDSGLFERLSLSRQPDEVLQLSRQGQVIAKPADLIKNPYVLEFLGLQAHSSYSESELESAIIGKIEHFLLELGKGFLFEARQKRFSFAEEHFFVDLVFYNRLLRCYVLIDLKLGKLTHQNLGQMQMYVNYFDRYVKQADENSTIGIILCKEKNDALVEITLPQDANIHAAEYQLYLPGKEELQRRLQEWAAESALARKPATKKKGGGDAAV